MKINCSQLISVASNNIGHDSLRPHLSSAILCAAVFQAIPFCSTETGSVNKKIFDLMRRCVATAFDWANSGRATFPSEISEVSQFLALIFRDELHKSSDFSRDFIRLSTMQAERLRSAREPRPLTLDEIYCWTNVMQKALVETWGFTHQEVIDFSRQVLLSHPSCVNFNLQDAGINAQDSLTRRLALMFYASNVTLMVGESWSLTRSFSTDYRESAFRLLASELAAATGLRSPSSSGLCTAPDCEAETDFSPSN